jgi:hypothetical protein
VTVELTWPGPTASDKVVPAAQDVARATMAACLPERPTTVAWRVSLAKRGDLSISDDSLTESERACVLERATPLAGLVTQEELPSLSFRGWYPAVSSESSDPALTR